MSFPARTRIVYAHDNQIPTPQADTEQVVSNVAALSRRRIDITLLLPRFGTEVSADRVRDFYKVSGSFDVEYYEPVRAIRAVQKTWAPLRIAWDRRVRSADVLYTRNLPVAMTATAAGHRVLLECYRPWPDQYPVLRPALRRMARSERFVGAILHSRFTRDSFVRTGIPERALLVAHNGYEPARMEPVLDRDAARNRLGLPLDRDIVVYAGRLGRDKGLGSLLQAADRCPEALFLLVGARPGDANRHGPAARPNVRLVPWQAYDAVAAYLYAADLLLVPASSDPLRKHGRTVLPMKLFGYMAAGRAIVAPDMADIREVLTDGRDGLLVPPDDPACAAAAICRALGDPALRKRLEEGAARTARGHTWDARAERIHRFLDERLAVSRSARGTSRGVPDSP